MYTVSNVHKLENVTSRIFPMGKLHKYISIKAKAKHTHVHTTEHRANEQKDHLQQQQSRHNQKKRTPIL